MRSSLRGTGELIRLALRRDRVLLPVWILLLPALAAAQLYGTIELYPTHEALAGYAAESNANPMLLGLLGPVFDANLGAILAWRVGVSGMIFTGIASALLVIRHTRAEEESGRGELVGSAVVGRCAPLSAALVVVLGANLVIAAVVAVTLVATGLPLVGSLALGLSSAAAGWVFAAVAAASAQMTESAGAARVIALAAFGLALLLRVVGDAGGERSPFAWLSWATPLGWTRLTRPFAGESWWVFALLAVPVVTILALAYLLAARRDLGAGLVPAREGRARAAPLLRSPLALAWRLQRGALLAWTAAFAVLGGLLGGISQTVSDLLGSAQLGGFLDWVGADDAGEAFMAFIVYVLSQIACAYVVTAVLRLRAEEASGRADPLLAAPVRRLRWAWSHLVFAVAGPMLLLGALGLSAGLAYGLAAGDVGDVLPRILGSAMSALPAVWVVGAIATAAYGLVPTLAAAISWCALAAIYVLELAWETQQIGDAVFGISPFSYVHPSSDAIGVAALAILVAVAAALTGAGTVGIRRRDIA